LIAAVSAQIDHKQVTSVSTSLQSGVISITQEESGLGRTVDIYSWASGNIYSNPTPTLIGNNLPWALGEGRLSVANVAGRCFININNLSVVLYEWTTPSTALASVALTVTGLNSIRAIVGSHGYLILVDQDRIFWSSPANPTDFAPSLITGAGSSGIQPAKGLAIYAIPTPEGFLIFCEQNIVQATYTGNSRYPFVLREVVNSSGISNANDVAVDYSNASAKYAFGSSGLMQIVDRKAELAFPDIQTFFRSHLREESIDGITFIRTINSQLHRKISFVCGRYLCVSYGTNYDVINGEGAQLVTPLYDFVLVYDTILQRWGKLNISHTDIFSAVNTIDSNFNHNQIAGIGYITYEGQVNIITFEQNATPLTSYILLGKYQISRSYNTVLQEIDIENVLDYTLPPRIYDVYSLDGKNQLYNQLTFSYNRGDLLRFFGSREAVNHSILVTSQPNLPGFNLNTVIMKFSKGGRI
jgi:hypothetical protein